MGENDPTDEERREGRERRSDADDAKWAERRTGQDRRDDEDRRGIYYSVQLRIRKRSNICANGSKNIARVRSK